MLFHFFHSLGIQKVNVSYASPQHNSIRVQDIDDH